MPYRYVQERQDYSDYSGGRVFYARPGYPAFPVRLASEMFQRGLALRAASGLSGPCRLYDPCCGGATHLAALAFLHGEAIAAIAASDVDPQALALARRNLSLLSFEGLERRMAEIERLLEAYGKASHAAALESARRLHQRLAGLVARRSLEMFLFQADAADPQALRKGLGDWQADLVLTDLPYGRLSAWQASAADASSPPVGRMLAALREFLAPGAIVAVAADKAQKAAHPAYRQVGKMRQGKRQVFFLAPEPSPMI